MYNKKFKFKKLPVRLALNCTLALVRLQKVGRRENFYGTRESVILKCASKGFHFLGIAWNEP